MTRLVKILFAFWVFNVLLFPAIISISRTDALLSGNGSVVVFRFSAMQYESLTWLVKKHEFRYGGEVYDVLDMRPSKGGYKLVCRHDVRDTRAFALGNRQEKKPVDHILGTYFSLKAFVRLPKTVFSRSAYKLVFFYPALHNDVTLPVEERPPESSGV